MQGGVIKIRTLICCQWAPKDRTEVFYYFLLDGHFEEGDMSTLNLSKVS